MKHLLGLTRSLLIALIFSLISSTAVLLCMIKFSNEFEQMGKILLSSLFWLGLLMEQLFVRLASTIRKKAEKQNKKRPTGGLPGICSFCKSRLGICADIALTVSLIVYIVLALCRIGVDVAQFIMLFMIVLSFRVHCIANGKNYRYMIQIKKQESKKHVQ